MKRIKKAVLSRLAFGLTLAMGAGSAIAETEGNGTFGTANGVSGVNGAATFSGVVGDGTSSSSSMNDVDIWAVNLVAGTTFSATVTYGASVEFGPFSPVLVLFYESGGNYYAVASNDPTTALAEEGVPASASDSISFATALTDTYYLTISAFSNAPMWNAILLFGDTVMGDADSPSTTTVPWNGWQNTSFSSGDYTVNATGLAPIPAAAWLFGAGLTGLGALSRRKKVS